MDNFYSDLVPGEQFPEVEELVRIGYDRKRKIAWLDMRNSSHALDGFQEDGVRRFLIGGVYKAQGGWQPIQLGDTAGGQYVSLSSNFSDPRKIIDFQRAILVPWLPTPDAILDKGMTKLAKGTTFGKSFTSASFVAKALKTGFGAIGKARGAGTKFTTWSIDDLLTYANRRPAYPSGLAPADRYSVPLIDFKALAPDLSYAPKGDGIKAKDMRDLQIIPSVAPYVGFTKPYPYEKELAEVNGGPIPFPRVNAFGFRGETRPPCAIERAGGFLPNYTRPDHIAKHKANLRTGGLSTSAGGPRKREAWDEAETGALNLKAFLQNQTFRGFISTTKSIKVAKHFATSTWNASAVPTDGQVDGWIYACHVIGAFDLPSPGDSNGLVACAEQEMTVPGMIDWDNVVACRQVKKTGEFHGPVYMRRSLSRTDRAAAKEIWQLLSGKSQG